LFVLFKTYMYICISKTKQKRTIMKAIKNKKTAAASKKHVQVTCQPIDWQVAIDSLKKSGYDMQTTESTTKKIRLARLRLTFGLGIYFGLRASDLLRVTWQQIAGSKFTITEKKTGKSREITINKDLAKVITESKKNIAPANDSELVMLPEQTNDTSEALQVQTFNTKLKRYIDSYCAGNTYTSHTLRKTFGRRVYEKNNMNENSLILLSQIFNHSNTAVTRRYIGLTDEKIAAVYLDL
jgi:integrase